VRLRWGILRPPTPWRGDVLSRRSMSRFFWLCMSTWDSEGEIAMGAMLGMCACAWVDCNLIDLIERRLNLGKID
jgi:hypothetical protein